MLLTALADTETKRQVAPAVRDIEATTCAEVVVMVRPASAKYRDVVHLAGAASAFARR